jgi:hypothetical protein
MAISTVSEIAAALAIGQRMRFIKNFTAPKGAGAFQSAWLGTGFPGAGTAPPIYTAGTGYQCTRTNSGALGQANGAVKNWIARFQAACTQPGVLYIADRLWHCGLIPFAADTYAITTPGSLPARITDNGVGCELWVEQDAACGAASGTLTANYTNTASAAKAGVIAAVVSEPVIGQMQNVPLQAGDLGIKSLTSVVTSNTWTSGTFGMTILKTHAQIEIPGANMGATQDWSKVLVTIPADACLFFYFLANGASAPVALGTVWVIDK